MFGVSHLIFERDGGGRFDARVFFFAQANKQNIFSLKVQRKIVFSNKGIFLSALFPGFFYSSIVLK